MRGAELERAIEDYLISCDFKFTRFRKVDENVKRALEDFCCQFVMAFPMWLYSSHLNCPVEPASVRGALQTKAIKVQQKHFRKLNKAQRDAEKYRKALGLSRGRITPEERDTSDLEAPRSSSLIRTSPLPIMQAVQSESAQTLWQQVMIKTVIVGSAMGGVYVWGLMHLVPTDHRSVSLKDNVNDAIFEDWVSRVKTRCREIDIPKHGETFSVFGDVKA